MSESVARLIASIGELRASPGKMPQAASLRPSWPEMGRSWTRRWAKELGRDLDIIARHVATAREPPTPEAGRESLEDVFWRLSSAHEKAYSIVALCFGLPYLEIAPQRIRFRVREEDVRSKINALAGQYPAAARLRDASSTVRGLLLLRHDLAHGLAPITTAHSLCWLEIARVRGAGVQYYQAFHLPPDGLRLHGKRDISDEAIYGRSLKHAERGLRQMRKLVDSLSELIPLAAELEPPPIVWHAVDAACYASTRQAAVEANRKAWWPSSPSQ